MSAQLSRRAFLQLTGCAGIAVALAGVTACAPVPGSQTGAGSSPAAETVALRKMAWGSPLEKENIEIGLEAFTEENPDITVEYIHTPDRYMEVLQTMLAAGNAPDVYKIGGGFYPDLAVKGALMDVTEWVKSDEVLGDPDYFFPFEEVRSTVDGKWYGIGSTFQWRLLYYNTAVLEDAGITPPETDPATAWTWPQFLETASQLTVDANGNHANDASFDVENVQQWGFFSADVNYDNFIISNGGAIIDAGSGRYMLDEPAAYEAVQAYADLRLSNQVAAQATVLQDMGMDAWQMLSSGRVAMILDGNWALQDISKMGFDFGVGVLPVLQQPGTITGSSWTGIYADTAHPQESWELFRYLNLDDYQAGLVRVGLWGVSHRTLLTEEGVQKWWDPAVHPENWLPLETDYKLNYGHVVPNVVGTLRTAPMITQALADVWIGNRTAEDVLTELTPQLNATLEEEQAKV